MRERSAVDGAVADSPAGADDGFAEFARARWGRLVRLAYSLTLDVGRAEDLVQESLARCGSSGRRSATAPRRRTCGR